MAVATLPAFTPDAAIGEAFGPVSSSVALPGTPASDSLVVVTNVSAVPVYVQLGTSSAVVAVVRASSLVLPGQVRVFAIGANTYIAGIILGGGTAYATVSDAVVAIETGS